MFSQDYAPNGGCFTPKGDLKVLLVCVGFGANDADLPMYNWPATQDFPDEIVNEELFYTGYAKFSTDIDSLRDIKNISRWYYEML